MAVHDWFIFGCAVVMLRLPLVKALRVGLAAVGTSVPPGRAALRALGWRALHESRMDYVLLLGIIFLARSMG